MALGSAAIFVFLDHVAGGGLEQEDPQPAHFFGHGTRGSAGKQVRENPWVISSASAGDLPVRRAKAWTGGQ